MNRGRRTCRLFLLLLAAGGTGTPALGGDSPGAVLSGSSPSPAVLSWRATKEEGVYGYLVYRSTEREGPFLRLGRAIIPVSRDPGEIHSYRFADETVEAGRTYYYYLDKIATTGLKSRFSGVVAKPIPPASHLPD